MKEIVAVDGSIPAANPTILTLVSRFFGLFGVAVDGSGNVFVGDFGNFQVVELDFGGAPSVAFATPTPVGSVDSTDGPQTVTVMNGGNAALTISGVSYPTDFPAFGSGMNLCTSTTSLTPGQTCTLSFNFPA